MKIVVTQADQPISITVAVPGALPAITARYTEIYTASGSLNPAIDVAIAISVVPIVLMLPPGVLDSHELVIKRFGPGSVGVIGTIDDVLNMTVLLDGAGLLQSTTLIWSQALQTWILLSATGGHAGPDDTFTVVYGFS